MKIFLTVLVALGLAPAIVAQTRTARPKPAEPDRLGLTCTQVLQKTSQEWVTDFNEKSSHAAADSGSRTLRAIAAYGICYDARTNHLAAVLGRSGKGPLMGARGNFGDFQKALDDLTAKALAASDKKPGTPEAAYAALYEKQFRYEFYQSYTQKSQAKRPLTPEESDQFSKAKNRFGELLGLLPEDQAHIVHAAFSEIFVTGALNDVTKLEVYRYAIFLLESPKDIPFSSPPF
ncbi:MAG: hypothetical protein WCC18_19790 [Candidatus Acidiferrales bacterium]